MTIDDAGFQAAGQERIPFEAAEMVAYAVVAGTLLYLIANVGVAILAAFSSPNAPIDPYVGSSLLPAPTIAQTLVRATYWATPYFSLFFYSLLGIVWWQLRAWTEVVEDPEENDEDTLKYAFGHPLRARTLSTTALVLSCTLLTGAAAAAAGNIIETAQSTSGQSGPVVTSGYLAIVGVGIATCTLAGDGIWAGLHFRRSINETFAESEDEIFEDELAEVVEADQW